MGSEMCIRDSYRSGLGTAKVSSHPLPNDIEDKLIKLMDRMNLKFGAIDFRLTPDGEYVFLEINPAGEYLFISERTELAIPESIATALDRRDKEHVN